MLFSSFPYDYPLLWTSSPLASTFLTDLETHLRFLHASPPIIPRILHILIVIGFAGFLLKLFKPSEANLLFDGASLVLYVVGVIVYVTNIIRGLRLITRGVWDEVPLVEGEEVIGREDSMKVLAASNTILALVLLGVLVLQAGQWYAERRERDERAQFEAMERKEGKGKGAQKKKQ